MAVFEQSEERLRQKRLKAEQAISLAMKNRWQEAVELNRHILEEFPKDVDAHNRLGKALVELGRYKKAREAYSTALRLDPVNSIASKNLQRLSKLAEEAAEAPPPSPVDPGLFIEESGRTVLTALVDTARPEKLAKIGSGDRVELKPTDSRVLVVDEGGELIGRVEPKLSKRLLKLLAMGNRYSAAVTAAEESGVRIIIRETHRDARMGSRPSFPMAAPPETFRSYIRGSLLKHDFEEEEEEEVQEAEEGEAEGLVEPELGRERHVVDEGDPTSEPSEI